MPRLVLPLIALAVTLPAAAADLYRWTDSQGMVHFSDRPPPLGTRNVDRMSVPEPVAATPPGPAKPAVVLYSAACGPICSQAEDYLRQRGVPFDLKAVDKDPALVAELRRRTGSPQVPVLYVGDSVQRGFSIPVWDKMLEVAGYPAPAAKPAQP